MSVIIRLQGLPWSASAMDIRHYFQGLNIPEGGVHIVGGDLGDAFIAFATDEDARQAMMLDDGKIKDSRAKLFLSSRTEMQKVIEMARSQPVAPQIAMPPNQQTLNPPMQEASTGPGRWSPRDSNRRRERSRSRDRDRPRDRNRRNRSNSRSRSPRRNRDRDNKRKDDRGRRGDDRSKRDETRKRDDVRDKMSEMKREPMEPMMGPRGGGGGAGGGYIMFNGMGGNMMPLAHGPYGDRMNQPHPGFVHPGAAEWHNRSWDDRQEMGLMPTPIRPMDKKEWEAAPLPDPFGRAARSRWSRDVGAGGEPFRNDLRPEGLAYDDRGPEPFGVRDVNHDRRGREPYGGVARGRMLPDVGDGVRGPAGPLMTRQGGSFDPRPRGEGFGSEFRMVTMDRRPPLGEQYKSNALVDSSMERRVRDEYSNEGKDVATDRRQAETPSNVGRVAPFRRTTSNEYPVDGPRRSMDNDNRMMDFRSGQSVSNGRPVHPSDRFEGFQSQRHVMGTCVEVIGMHPDATRSNVHDFFHGLVMTNDGIKLYSDERSKTTSAVIRFSSESDRDEALKRNRQYMGSRCVQVIPCTESYFDKMASCRYSSSKMNSETDYTTCVLIRGLPFNFKEEEIVDLFEGMKVVSVLMERDRAGDITGNGFIEFDSVIDAKQAANSKKKIGHKYLELSLVGRERMLAAKNISEGKKDCRSDSDRPRTPTTDCCLIQGLPNNATDKHIVNFFDTESIMPVTIHIMLNKIGEPSGDAFCEFKSVQECEQALRKNKQYMGPHLIYVKSVSRKEMLEALGIPHHPGATGPINSGRMDRPPIRTSMDDRGNDHCPPDRSLIDRMPMDRVMNDRVPLLEHPVDWSAHGGHDGMPRALQGFGKKGCVVGAKNIPYRLTIDEMLHFFRDYNITKDDIIRRYNEKGQPTGEAKIAFRTPAEAQKAVHELNQQLVGGRPCSLFLSNN